MDPVADLTVRFGLTLLLGSAAGHKLRDARRFRASVESYAIVPRSLAAPVAALLIAGEVLLALSLVAACVAPALRAASLVGAAALLVLYAAAILVNLARGRRHLDCGCAGPAARRPISGALVTRNLLLAGAALLASGEIAARPFEGVDALTVVAAVAAGSALYAAIDHLLAQAPLRNAVRGEA